MTKYSLHLIDSDNEEFDFHNARYEDVVESSFEQIDSDNSKILFNALVSALNQGTISDMNWIFVCDNERKAIIIN